MNDCSISSQWLISIWIAGVTFTKLLVFLVDSMFVNYDTKSIFPLSTIASMNIEIKWKTVVSLLNNIFVSG